MKARDRQHMIEAWTSHIRELIYLCDSADDLAQYSDIKTRLLAMLERKADKDFPKE